MSNPETAKNSVNHGLRDRPNIIYINTDDTGRYIGPYGFDIDTPALEAFANEGILFRDAHTAAPTCSPSRAAQMTGMVPHSTGMLGLAHHVDSIGAFTFDDYDRHLARYLGDQGFVTVLAGQQHEACPNRLNRQEAAREILGYDHVIDGDVTDFADLPIDHQRTQHDLANASAAADYIRSDPDDPFFLSLGLWNTHQPMPLDQDLVDPDYVQVPSPLPDHPDVREEIAAYHVLAEYVDQCVKQIFEALRETNQYDETIVIFTTDHGLPFPQMKCTLFEAGTGIALLARFPEAIADAVGTVEDSLVSNVDLFPTLCDGAGVPIPDWVHGSSFLPLVRGETESIRDEVFSEVSYHAAYEPKRCIRTERYTYIRRYTNGGQREWSRDGSSVPRVRANTDGNLTKEVARKAGLFNRPLDREALYDRTLDPAERENLATDPEFRNVRDNLASRLASWMAATDDPLIDGSVPRPDGDTPESLK